MGYLHDDILDNGLSELADANALHICSAEPATYAEATATYTLGVKTTPTVGAPEAGDVSGRKVVISAFSDGEVTDTDTATNWALVDTVGERLLAAGDLSASQAVTDGNSFSLTAFAITFPAPA